MKKNLMAIPAALLFLVSCSSDNSGEIQIFPDEENLSPIEIFFSSARIMAETSTRAKIEDVNSLDRLGVFCLAHDYVNGNSSWGWTSENAIIMNNEPSEVIDDTVRFLSDFEKRDEAHYYYPVIYRSQSSYFVYDFYAYYPYTDSKNVDLNDDEVSITYTIDGTTDLIWGVAANEKNTNAYCDRYYRNGESAIDPVLMLDHMLTRLDFYLKPGPIYNTNGTPDYTEASKLTVTGIKIKNTPTRVRLLIADRKDRKTSLSRDGRITGSFPSDLSLKENDDSDLKPVRVPNSPDSPKSIGGGIMLYPSESYSVTIYAQKEDGSQITFNDVPLAWQNGDSFERGKSYKISVTIYNPQEILLRANLEPWDSVDGPELY